MFVDIECSRELGNLSEAPRPELVDKGAVVDRSIVSLRTYSNALGLMNASPFRFTRVKIVRGADNIDSFICVIFRSILSGGI